ncbi:MAG TPA: hypothetical protein VES67_19555 [Vicinamibacterales bacterium]|nr:hypothetical protein [Vicinamibacterales bacterium]
MNDVLPAIMLSLPLSLPLHRSDDEKCEENQSRRGGEPQEKLAERVGVLARDFAKANEINGFATISRSRNDLASSSFRRRFRPFAGLCRFFYFNGTRHGTRRGALGEWSLESLDENDARNFSRIVLGRY